MTAHAGCQGTDPDSLESVEAGIQAGAEVIEVDLRFTRDGRPVLHHDPFRLEAEASLVPLEAALRLVARHEAVFMNLDLKEPQGAAALPGLLAKTSMAERVFFSGLEPRAIPSVAQACPGIPYVVDPPPSELRLQTINHFRGLVRRARELGAFALNLSYRSATTRLMEVCRLEGFPVYVWTVDDERTMQRMLERGVASITTRRVDLLLRLLTLDQQREAV